MTLRLLPVLLPLSLLSVACTDTEEKDLDDGTGEETTDDTTDSGTPSTDAPTWHADVQPIMATHCTRCHYDGGLGPSDFTDLDTVKALAPAMRGSMDAGQMPPAAADPGCRDYEGSEHLTLPDSAAATFSAWVDADMPEGEPGEAVETVQIKDTLDDPDAVLMMEAPYTPTYEDPSNPGNEYRCFAVEAGELAGQSITAMAPVVGNNQLVHHIVLFTMPSESLTEDMRDPAGWDCIDGMGSDSLDGMLTAWAPGMLPIEFPEGTGLAIEPDHHIVVQMHYFYNGPETDGASDQSGYAFHVADGPVSPVFMAPVGDFSFAIPPGATDYTSTDTFENSFLDLQVLGMFPHMHQLGTWFNAVIKHDDGTETCLVDGAYSFDNQMTYQFKEPAEFKQGDSVEFTCTWDNSEGTNTVTYGERTDEEMCFFFTFVTL